MSSQEVATSACSALMELPAHDPDAFSEGTRMYVRDVRRLVPTAAASQPAVPLLHARALIPRPANEPMPVCDPKPVKGNPAAKPSKRKATRPKTTRKATGKRKRKTRAEAEAEDDAEAAEEDEVEMQEEAEAEAELEAQQDESGDDDANAADATARSQQRATPTRRSARRSKKVMPTQVYSDDDDFQ